MWRNPGFSFILYSLFEDSSACLCQFFPFHRLQLLGEPFKTHLAPFPLCQRDSSAHAGTPCHSDGRAALSQSWGVKGGISQLGGQRSLRGQERPALHFKSFALLWSCPLLPTKGTVCCAHQCFVQAGSGKVVQRGGSCLSHSGAEGKSMGDEMLVRARVQEKPEAGQSGSDQTHRWDLGSSWRH